MPRLVITDSQRDLINRYYQQFVAFVALTQPDKDLRAPILRSRLNLYRMLMIIAVLRRHEEEGSAEDIFGETAFATTEADLRWGLAYIFYTVMQTSALYNRLRREEKEEAKPVACISPLAFLHVLPRQFTAAVATKQGEELGMKRRTVCKHLRTLCTQGYLLRIRQGVYSKPTRTNKKLAHAA